MALSTEKTLEQLMPYIERFKQSQRLVYGVVIAFIAIILVADQLMPAWSQFRQKNKEMSAYKQTLEKKRLNLLNKEKVEQQMKDLKSALAKAESNFFTPEQHQAFAINTLSQLAIKHQNRVLSVRYNPESNRGENLSAYPIVITLEGGFMGLSAFLHDLEKFPQFTRVLSFNFAKKSANPPVLQLVCEIETYVINS